ncbi:MAG: NAD(P)/FAD-dependent oxidoreductase [Candidatus Vogelbacteria bacterium]|nr:NAD(P)/FAD-dependent oxidoreductase [Candidatus Vogelbacteria bacterium]
MWTWGAYPGQGENVRKFTRILERIRAEVKALPDRKINWWEYITKGWNFRTLWMYQNKTLQNVFDECNLSREAQAVLIAQAGDFMAPPNELSIFAYTGLFGGYNTGAYYPTKHFNHFIQKVVESIEGHEGCHIYYETPVSKINVDGDKVTSIETEDGKVFTADRYICNMDPQLASYMIGREKFPADYIEKLDYDYSHTGLMVYLGLHGLDLREKGFGKFNTWHLERWDMNQTWREGLAGGYSKPWVFMGTPSLHSDVPGIVPAGCHILEVETLGGYDYFKKFLKQGQKAYKEEKWRVANRLLSIVREKYIPELNNHIALKLVGSPTTNEDFCRAPRGNAYGSHLTPKNMGLGRLKSDSPFRNLYFCNASSGYGGICPTVGTGNALYMKLTGDVFYRPSEEPSDNELVKMVRGGNQ